jgi:hypothetical protein
MQDKAIQRAVLALALDAHPKSLNIPDLARQFAEGEAERAVRDLVGVGLLVCSGLSVRPSPALAYFQRLDLP